MSFLFSYTFSNRKKMVVHDGDICSVNATKRQSIAHTWIRCTMHYRHMLLDHMSIDEKSTDGHLL